MTRAVLYLRLVPATIWLMSQIVMVGAVTPVQAEPAELRKLAKILQIDRITLCNKSENGAIDAKHCPWCQGFAETILPDTPLAVCRSECVDQAGRVLASAPMVLKPAGLAYTSRAPPA